MKTKSVIKRSQTIAILSFLIGTAIFVMYYLTSASYVLMLGYVFVVISAIINIIFLVFIILRYLKEEQHKTHLFITGVIILLNIPVFLFYSWITLLLMDTMRVRFVNSTQETLTEIKITGCKNKSIKKLKAGQSKMIWIYIEKECAINISYLLNGTKQEETILEYATSSTGHKVKYKIGRK